ncbi:hypothetical protein CPB86DRAFT_784607 [Serendipita vermifera]|nr:hypothetical protein CPB86DRAFT_784607 [Serendipita vermifera]
MGQEEGLSWSLLLDWIPAWPGKVFLAISLAPNFPMIWQHGFRKSESQLLAVIICNPLTHR